MKSVTGVPAALEFSSNKPTSCWKVCSKFTIRLLVLLGISFVSYASRSRPGGAQRSGRARRTNAQDDMKTMERQLDYYQIPEAQTEQRDLEADKVLEYLNRPNTKLEDAIGTQHCRAFAFITTRALGKMRMIKRSGYLWANRYGRVCFLQDKLSSTGSYAWVTFDNILGVQDIDVGRKNNRWKETLVLGTGSVEEFQKHSNHKWIKASKKTYEGICQVTAKPEKMNKIVANIPGGKTKNNGALQFRVECKRAYAVGTSDLHLTFHSLAWSKKLNQIVPQFKVKEGTNDLKLRALTAMDFHKKDKDLEKVQFYLRKAEKLNKKRLKESNARLVFNINVENEDMPDNLRFIEWINSYFNIMPKSATEAPRRRNSAPQCRPRPSGARNTRPRSATFTCSRRLIHRLLTSENKSW